MKAITVRQPWASLIAAGVKTIETRPRACSYRGRVAIHAAASPPKLGATVGDWQVDETIIRTYPTLALVHYADGVAGGPDRIPLPLGAVVASAVLTDCVQIIDLDGVPGIRSDEAVRIARARGRFNYADQLPLGDFSPGRWALLLDDIAPTTERCPWCWGENHSGLDKLAEVHAGSAQIGHTTMHAYTVCSVCEGASRTDPVPARGQQAVPWEWTP